MYRVKYGSLSLLVLGELIVLSVIFQDLSSNGLFLNGHWIHGSSVILMDKDEIQIPYSQSMNISQTQCSDHQNVHRVRVHTFGKQQGENQCFRTISFSDTGLYSYWFPSRRFDESLGAREMGCYIARAGLGILRNCQAGNGYLRICT